MKNRLKAEQVNIIINNQIDEIFIKGNLFELKQCLINIIINSVESLIDYKVKEICINLRIEDKFASIEIIDNGIGIESENLDSVTKSFYTTKKDAIGIGLTIVKYIIEYNHSGELKISSKVGGGTKIQLMFRMDEEKN